MILGFLDFFGFLAIYRQRKKLQVKTTGSSRAGFKMTGFSEKYEFLARRTKSRGPKGLQLEVGARRAPKLLVCTYLFLGQTEIQLKCLCFPGSCLYWYRFQSFFYDLPFCIVFVVWYATSYQVVLDRD